MSKTTKIILGIIAVVAIAATVSYAIYRYLGKGKKPLAFFKSKFNDDGSVEAIDATDELCDDAVCAVDMCMPY